ncbi:MAG: Calx-beta domain-containing protein [Vicinamibacteria bacterium]
MTLRSLPLALLALAWAGPALAQAPNPTLAAIPPNTARNLGPYTSEPLCGVPIGVTDYSKMVYDPVRHQLMMFGGGHATTPRTDVDVFSFATLAWTSAYAPTPAAQLTLANFDPGLVRWTTTGHPIARHTYDQLVVDPGTGDLVMMAIGQAGALCTGDFGNGGGRVGHYDHETRTWSFSPTSDNVFGPGTTFPGTEYDPVSGLIVVVGGTGLYTYDPATRVKTLRKAYDQPAMGYANNLVYYPPNQRFYFIARGAPTRVWEVTLDRTNWASSTVVEMATTGAVFDSEESGFAYDSWNEVIGGGVAGGVFHVFEPEQARWTALTMQVQAGGGPVGTQAFHALDFDPVDGVFLFLTEYDSGSRMWAYRYGSGAAVPTLSLDDAAAAEGNAGTTAVAVTARLSQPGAQPVTASFATANGTAAAGSDYQAAAGTVTFPAGTVSRTIGVNVIGDAAVEPDETFVLNLTAPVGATLGDAQGQVTIADDDAPSLATCELAHGARFWDDLSPQTGPAGQDAYRISQAPRASYEVVLDAVSGDAAPPVLERLAADHATVLQTGTPVGTGGGVALRWENTAAAAVVNQQVRVRSGGCGTDCGPDDVYRVRARETTASVARFNNAAGQGTVLVLQNTTARAASGHAYFWSASGAPLGVHAFALAPRATAVVNTATVAGVAGQTGSITVAHDAGYGGIAGKAVAVDPASGASFDTPLGVRP